MSRAIIPAICIFGLGSILTGGAQARTDAPKASFAPIGEIVSTPYGCMDFCSRQPQECNHPVLAAADIDLTQQTWNTLNHINHQVNDAIEPVSNVDHWGTIADHWDYPTDGKGDCKIFALQKRKLLIDMGFPRQALLITVVRDQKDHGHDILTTKTTRGDFILDNLTDKILPWDATSYRFVKRQSQEDPNVWIAIGKAKTPHQFSSR